MVAACFYILLPFRCRGTPTGLPSDSGVEARLRGRAMSRLPDPTLGSQGVHMAFGDNPVLRGVSFDIDDHEVVALIGASGSGKSTLLRCVDLLEHIDSGSILLDGVDISWPGFNANEARRKIGIVFQSFNLFPHRSVLENVTLAPRKVLSQSKDQAEEVGALALLTRFGLGGTAGDFPDRLSGGQQQRVAIVRALAMKPKIMLFDEITSRSIRSWSARCSTSSATLRTLG